ncbi:MAG: putative aspartate aminotransferase [Chloroflexi bacterium]|nr:putative aspartate aminotransferase [Chloroflexota bacterium]
MNFSRATLKINPNILNMEYAVRGPIPKRAAELKRQGKKVISCNIGNPQALGQRPITYYRQVLSLVEEPSKIDRERRLKELFEESPHSPLREEDFISEHVLALSERLLEKTEHGLGAYTASQGFLFVREAIADFIDQRDECQRLQNPCSDPNDIFLTTGASDGARRVLNMLITDKKDGIMIPIPQYPLYSAALKLYGGVQVNYYPDEENDWALDRSALETSIAQAREDGVNVKAIVIINPGNPTGAILDQESLCEVIAFAKENNLAIIADEVYQENVYGAEFISAAKALGSEKEVPLFSLHSISKGFLGECGHRGGYFEVRNPPAIEGSEADFMDVLIKQASVNLCSNTAGQILTYLMVTAPDNGSPAYEQYDREKEEILADLYEKASMVREAFQDMDGVECFGKTGAMYLFPRLNKLPEGKTDFEYCMALLEETGLSTVNGSGFGQMEGTHHLRIAFLPPMEKLEEVLPKWIAFHNEYVNRGE